MPEVSDKMVQAAKKALLAHCWDDGVLSLTVGFDQAVKESLCAAIAVRTSGENSVEETEKESRQA